MTFCCCLQKSLDREALGLCILIYYTGILVEGLAMVPAMGNYMQRSQCRQWQKPTCSFNSANCFSQDAWAVKERLNAQEMLMLGVFDGHGAEGKVVSNHIATNLHKIMAKSALCKVSKWYKGCPGNL